MAANAIFLKELLDNNSGVKGIPLIHPISGSLNGIVVAFGGDSKGDIMIMSSEQNSSPVTNLPNSLASITGQHQWNTDFRGYNQGVPKGTKIPSAIPLDTDAYSVTEDNNWKTSNWDILSAQYPGPITSGYSGFMCVYNGKVILFIYDKVYEIDFFGDGSSVIYDGPATPIPGGAYCVDYTNGKMYFAGSSSAGYDMFQVLDLNTFQWTVLTSLPEARQNGILICAVDINNKIYFCGGSGTTTNNPVWAYDLGTTSWSLNSQGESQNIVSAMVFPKPGSSNEFLIFESPEISTFNASTETWNYTSNSGFYSSANQVMFYDEATGLFIKLLYNDIVTYDPVLDTMETFSNLITTTTIYGGPVADLKGGSILFYANTIINAASMRDNLLYKKD